jgi:CBS domain-containing protein
MLKNGHPSRGQHLYPVVDEYRHLSGVITRKDLAKSSDNRTLMSDIARRDPVMAAADESLRTVVYRMAETGFTRMPVVESGEERRIVGMISLDDLLHARTRNHFEERSRERVLHIRFPFRDARKTAPEQE